MFKQLNDNVEVEDNRLGGGRELLETGSYNGTISMAYGDSFDSGATYIKLKIDLDNGGTYEENLIITGKTGNNFYTDKKTGVQRGLPGYTIANDLCLLTVGTPLSETEGEDKQVLVYDFDLSQEVPQSKYVLTDLIGKPIVLTIQKIRKNKQAKNESTGKYDNTAEEQIVNEIHTVFSAETGHSATELRNQVEEAEFLGKWSEKYTDQLIDRYKEVKGGSGAFGKSAGGAAKTATGNPFKK